MNWPRHELQALLGIEHPILLAPMAGATTPRLAAAVSGAGALGGHGCASLGTDEVRRDIEAIRAATNRPFQVNFFTHPAPPGDGEAGPAMRRVLQGLWDEAGLGPLPAAGAAEPGFDEALLEAVLATRPPVVSFHFGLPGEAAVDAVRQAGCRIVASATTVAEARELERRGVDAVIAQGAEAGGHRGTFLGDVMGGTIGTFALVPQVADAVSLPVIAAGGIADGRGIAAALMLGAAGVQIGTAFLSCPEATVTEAHRKALLSARASDAETVVTKGISGRPARGLRNRLMDVVTAHQGEAAPFPVQNALTRPLGASGRPELEVMWSGQAAALSRAMPAAELVALLVEETDAALAGR